MSNIRIPRYGNKSPLESSPLASSVFLSFRCCSCSTAKFFKGGIRQFEQTHGYTNNQIKAAFVISKLLFFLNSALYLSFWDIFLAPLFFGKCYTVTSALFCLNLKEETEEAALQVSESRPVLICPLSPPPPPPVAPVAAAAAEKARLFFLQSTKSSFASSYSHYCCSCRLVRIFVCDRGHHRGKRGRSERRILRA